MNNLTDNANDLMSEITLTAKELRGVSQNLEKLLVSANNQKLAEQLKQSLQGITNLTKDLSSGSRGYEDLRKTLGSVNNVMQELKPLLNQLKHQPNGLIFNSGQNEILEPKKHSGANN